MEAYGTQSKPRLIAVVLHAKTAFDAIHDAVTRRKFTQTKTNCNKAKLKTKYKSQKKANMILFFKIYFYSESTSNFDFLQTSLTLLSTTKKSLINYALCYAF